MIRTLASSLPARLASALASFAVTTYTVVALPWPVHAQSADATPTASVGSVAAAERARFAALVAGDYTRMSTMLGDDLVYTHSTGTVDTKESYMAPLLAGRTRYVQADPRDTRVTLYGTTAVTTGTVRVTAHVGNDVRPSHLRYTSVWTLRDGRWQMVAWQATRLP